jgi:hypothetical protein
MTRLAALYPQTAFTTRQRSLANRLLNGEDLRFGGLNSFDRDAALALHRKDVLTFAATTNRLHLNRVFADGSSARLDAAGWAMSTPPAPAAGTFGCRAAEFAAGANAVRG